MKKTLVIIPTYNERETLPVVVDSLLKHGLEVVVVDDGSPDGTALFVKDLMVTSSNISLIERPGKLGLGTAYVEGFKWGLDKGYDYFIEMDADLSHDPVALPPFLTEMEKGYDLVIGSRYLNGAISVVGWDFRRLMLSKFGNYYASWILGLPLTDLTSGFRCYSRRAIEAINLEKIHSNGYSFQIEMAYSIAAKGYRVGEIPIIFYERASGSSKMSKKIIREAVVLPWRLRLVQMFAADRESSSHGFWYHCRTVVGFLSVMVGIVAGLWLGWWLSTEGDIVEVIHRAKMRLPDWGWMVLKVGLSAAAAGIFVGLFLAAAVFIFSGGGRKRTSRDDR